MDVEVSVVVAADEEALEVVEVLAVEEVEALEEAAAVVEDFEGANEVKIQNFFHLLIENFQEILPINIISGSTFL